MTLSSPAPLVAVVEDNPSLLTDLVEFLNLQGFAAQGFEDGEQFFQSWPATPFHLLLLDVALPGMNGLEIARQVRAQGWAGGRQAGIVMLTALGSNGDHVLGLEAGADMYLSKSSSLEVIEAACRSLLRRLVPGRADAGASPGAAQRRRAPETLDARGDVWRLHSRDWRLTAPNGQTLPLTHAEVMMLVMLFAQPGQAITREALLRRLDKQDTLSNLRNLDNTASRLRRKVQAACGMEFPLRSCYGKGYTFSGRCGQAS